MEPSHVGVTEATVRTGKSPAALYICAARQRVSTRLDPSGKLQFEVASLDRLRAEEVARKARRHQEQIDAAARVSEITAKRRRARPLGG